jgi:hypothetical protein
VVVEAKQWFHEQKMNHDKSCICGFGGLVVRWSVAYTAADSALKLPFTVHSADKNEAVELAQTGTLRRGTSRSSVQHSLTLLSTDNKSSHDQYEMREDSGLANGTSRHEIGA